MSVLTQTDHKTKHDEIVFEMARAVRQMLEFDMCLVWLLDRRAGQFDVVACL